MYIYIYIYIFSNKLFLFYFYLRLLFFVRILVFFPCRTTPHSTRFKPLSQADNPSSYLETLSPEEKKDALDWRDRHQQVVVAECFFSLIAGVSAFVNRGDYFTGAERPMPPALVEKSSTSDYTVAFIRRPPFFTSYVPVRGAVA